MTSYIVAALYKFVALPDYSALQEPLLAFCKEQGITGTLLLAEEGINGTISGSRDGIDRVLEYLKADPRLADLSHKESMHSEQPFYRMKVKLKKEIVTLGVDGVSPTHEVGQYVKPEDWNALIQDPEVLVVDTRNEYEVAIGTFENALDPKTRSFREFPAYVQQHLDPKVHKKVAMFCTGGIRCEKSTSYMLQQGFEQVYHLQGGILNYLEQVKPEDSLWQGECFVFDNRVAVDHQLSQGQYAMCHACRYPITEQEMQDPRYEEGVSCPHCHETLPEKTRQRAAERQKQCVLANARNQRHIGAVLDPKA